ncbi:hypothetical protein TUBRATIS_11820 [Tubulinosema ratisbonensis]|uniref:Uncharacterized protein n=1 Tax=Tubulinosema ratisbonensis TaxID=291195 RepID=A0A437AM94_9MICR|nr:hypothetical protein TUBRATIS_11820 [Tubulinosema ratisbonensis]
MPKLENELPENENPPKRSDLKEKGTKAEDLSAVFKEFFDEIFQITGKKNITKETILELVDTLDFFKDLLDKDDLCQDIVEPAKIVYRNLYDKIQSTKYDELKSISISADRKIPDIRNKIKQKSEELKTSSKENDAALREKLDSLLEDFLKLTFEKEIAIEEQKLLKSFLVDLLKVSEKQMSECLDLPVENVKKLIPGEFLNDTFKANEEKAQMIKAELNNLSKKLQQFGEIKSQETKKTEELNNQLQQHKENFEKNLNAQKVKLEDEINKMKEIFKTQGKEFLPELPNKIQNLMQQTNENVIKLVDDLQSTITQNKLPENLAIGLEPLDLTTKAKFDLNNLFSEFSTLKNHLVYSELTPELKTSFDKLNIFFDKLVDSNKTENVKLQLKDEQGNVIYPKVNIINEPEIKQPENKNQPSGETGQKTSLFSFFRSFANWFRKDGDETQQKPKIQASSEETPQPPDNEKPPKTSDSSEETLQPSDSEESSETPTGGSGVPPKTSDSSEETPQPPDSEESSETPIRDGKKYKIKLPPNLTYDIKDLTLLHNNQTNHISLESSSLPQEILSNLLTKYTHNTIQDYITFLQLNLQSLLDGKETKNKEIFYDGPLNIKLIAVIKHFLLIELTKFTLLIKCIKCNKINKCKSNEEYLCTCKEIIQIFCVFYLVNVVKWFVKWF